MYSKEVVIEKLRSFQPIFAKEGVLLLGIFGSFARDEAKKGSDIDILVETTPKFLERYKGFSGFSKLQEMKEKLEHELKTQVDLIDKQGLMQHKNTYIIESTLYV